MTIDLNTYLNDAGIPVATTLVMRHTPTEKYLRDNLGTWAVQDHDLFNAYQCTQLPRQENMLKSATHLVSCIGQKKSGEALFVGIYRNSGHHKITEDEARLQRKLYGTAAGSQVWFELELLPQMTDLKGKLAIGWPGLARAWTRWAANNTFPVKVIYPESVLIPPMPSWRELTRTWEELKTLPESWKDKLKEWRAIYLIQDISDGKYYVGSAYGDDNLDHRWAEYARTGHGGNVQLREPRDPKNFRFSILELVGPSMPKDEVIAIEQSWMLRLQTRTDGLNS